MQTAACWLGVNEHHPVQSLEEPPSPNAPPDGGSNSPGSSTSTPLFRIDLLSAIEVSSDCLLSPLPLEGRDNVTLVP